MLLLTIMVQLHASDIHSLNLDARSIGLGLSDITTSAWTNNPGSISNADKANIAFSQARLGFDQYAYQINASIPTCAHRLT